MSLEKVRELKEHLDTDDVAQKRYLMYNIFDRLLDERLSAGNIEAEISERIEKLKDLDGYMYKLSQDFLTSSSTLKKQNKLEKIIGHVEKKT